MPTLHMMPKVVTLTGAAVRRVQSLMAANPDALGLEIGVKKGGCAGMEYTMAMADKKGPHDEVVEQDGAVLLIEPSADHVPARHRDGLPDRQAGQPVRVQQPEPARLVRLRRERQPGAGRRRAASRQRQVLVSNDPAACKRLRAASVITQDFGPAAADRPAPLGYWAAASAARQISVELGPRHKAEVDTSE